MQSKFSALPLSPALLTVLSEIGFEDLTPIQAQAIPALIEKRDVIGQAQTGSGKTAAFALPILERLDLTSRLAQAVVLCPTRELCAQVATQIRTLGRKLGGLRVQVLCGGQPVRPQKDALTRGVHVVVGTPGRVLDHLGRENLDLQRARMVVLDEADRMLDMGFAEDMRQILAALPTDRQTALFSATFPRSIADLSAANQKNPLRITIESAPEAAPSIRQRALLLDEGRKYHGLLSTLARHPHASALVFCNLKLTVKELATDLQQAGVSAAAIHGDLDQLERDQVMALFRNQSIRVLVATDVAARGIDISELDLVINRDFPDRIDSYVHRIGRTGRAGKTGVAVTFTNPAQRERLPAIEEQSGLPLETERFDALAATSGGNIEQLEKKLAGPAPMATLRILGGRKDKLRPGDLLGALTGDAGGLHAAQIGKIEIHDRVTYVAIAHAESRRAARALSNGRIKGKRFRTSLV